MRDLIRYSFTKFEDLDNDELRLVWEWRNNNEIRKWMYNPEVIPFENHEKFVLNLRGNETMLYFLVRRKNVAIGVFSIVDIFNNEGEWGYYIAPQYHDQHLGVEFYNYILQYVFETLNIKKLNGYALVSNKGANSLNDLFGFEKKLIKKGEEGKQLEYFQRELVLSKWVEEVKENKKIKRLLQLSLNKEL